MSAQSTVGRIGQGPVLAAILGATAVVGFGIGILIGSQPAATPTGRPAISSVAPSASPLTTTATSDSPAAPSGPRQVLVQFSGTEHDVSEPFEVVPGWQIRWQTDGTSLAIAVTGDQNLGVVVDEPGPASGVTSLAPAGTFQLNIVASGPWSITVIQGEGPAPT